MAHERKKKAGQRKDKKNQRMREDVERRKAEGTPKDFGTDQKDIQTFKPGAADDRTTGPSVFKGGRGPVGKEPKAPQDHRFKK